MTTETRNNEAAERLRSDVKAAVDGMNRFWDSEDGDADALAEAMGTVRRSFNRRLTAALAAERRATAKRIRTALLGPIAAEIDADTTSMRWRDGAGWTLTQVLSILDEEAAS